MISKENHEAYAQQGQKVHKLVSVYFLSVETGTVLVGAGAGGADWKSFLTFFGG
jgi:tetrahydromethanopterin S-methyltransferase subunit D